MTRVPLLRLLLRLSTFSPGLEPRCKQFTELPFRVWVSSVRCRVQCSTTTGISSGSDQSSWQNTEVPVLTILVQGLLHGFGSVPAAATHERARRDHKPKARHWTDTLRPVRPEAPSPNAST